MENENRIKELEQKYWTGETNLIEESALFEAYRKERDIVSDELAALFDSRALSSNINLKDDFEDEFWGLVDKNETKNSSGFKVYDFLKYAAVGIIVIGLGFALTKLIPLNNSSSIEGSEIASTVSEDTYESPELAFEEAKKALLIASGKLNKEEKKINEIKRFHHATVTVKGSQKKEYNGN